MAGTSTVYTVGTALNRAADAAVEVELLVEGQWMRGTVGAVDGHGVVLVNGGVDHVVVRLERVAAVRVHDAAPSGVHARSLGRPIAV